jgi:hypothetical protein
MRCPCGPQRWSPPCRRRNPERGEGQFPPCHLCNDVADIGVGKRSTLDGGPERIVTRMKQRSPLSNPPMNSFGVMATLETSARRRRTGHTQILIRYTRGPVLREVRSRSRSSSRSKPLTCRRDSDPMPTDAAAENHGVADSDARRSHGAWGEDAVDTGGRQPDRALGPYADRLHGSAHGRADRCLFADHRHHRRANAVPAVADLSHLREALLCRDRVRTWRGHSPTALCSCHGHKLISFTPTLKPAGRKNTVRCPLLALSGPTRWGVVT